MTYQPACPHCRSSLDAEPLGGGRFWCPCCSREFQAREHGGADSSPTHAAPVAPAKTLAYRIHVVQSRVR